MLEFLLMLMGVIAVELLCCCHADEPPFGEME